MVHIVVAEDETSGFRTRNLTYLVTRMSNSFFINTVTVEVMDPEEFAF